MDTNTHKHLPYPDSAHPQPYRNLLVSLRLPDPDCSLLVCAEQDLSVEVKLHARDVGVMTNKFEQDDVVGPVTLPDSHNVVKTSLQQMTSHSL